jgi:hypothetical protein
MQTGDTENSDPFSTTMVLNAPLPQEGAQRLALIRTIKAIADAPAPIMAEAVRELAALENRLYGVIQDDRRRFFAATSKTEAEQITRDLHVMHSVAAKTLQTLVERRGEWTHGDADTLLQRVVAFGLYHHGAAVKWCFFRHEPIKPTVWPDLHALYKFAESHGFANTPIELFAVEAKYKITAQSLYMRALMLEVLNTGSLSVPQIEIADKWLAEWTTEYALDVSYVPRSHALFVDLDLMAGMQLVTGNAAKPSYRYARIEGLKEQVEAVRTQLRTGNPYQGRGEPNDFSMEEHVALLTTIERLYATLLQASASRIEARKPVENLTAEVRLGFHDARLAMSDEVGKAAPVRAERHTRPVPPAGVGHAEPAGHAKTKFAGLELNLELQDTGDVAPAMDASATRASPAADARENRWKIHDMSSKGIGLIVDRPTGDRISVGQLLAVKPDGFAYFMVGVIVRKLTQRTLGETLLGVEMLSYRPLPMTLYRYTNARDAMPDPGNPPVPAIYLPGRDQDGKSDALVLPSGDFGLKNVFSLPTKSGNFRVRINRVLRKGDDWVGLRFEVISRK